MFVHGSVKTKNNSTKDKSRQIPAMPSKSLMIVPHHRKSVKMENKQVLRKKKKTPFLVWTLPKSVG